jgi:hypothetical protein
MFAAVASSWPMPRTRLVSRSLIVLKHHPAG